MCLVAGAAMGRDLKDLYYGEALFYADQGEYFEAIARLDAEMAQHYAVDEPDLDSLSYHIKGAKFFVGDFELRYRMHLRAGRAMQAVLEGDVDEEVRNEAAFRLARIYFQKDQPDDALRALERIDGRVPDDIQDDVEFLKANVYMALGRPSDAVAVLRPVQGSSGLRGFTAYNLGIALLQEGRQQEAMQQLDRAGQIKASDQGGLAIRDKSNLILGTLQFKSSEFGPAQHSLDRVRLEGPFANQALLRAGWADVSAENFERAIVPWTILVERDSTDAAVQEAMLALPFAYSKLNVYGRAAVLYGQAVETFGNELTKVNASIKSIREGKFLKALVREEIRQDKDWVIRLRNLPETPETYYLMALMASHDFQTALQNYLDLEDLRKKLLSWQGSFDAYEDLIQLRRAYYEPLLPEIDSQFRELDAKIRLRLQQRERLDQRIQAMLIAPRPDLLATADERLLSIEIAGLGARLQGAGHPDQTLQRRVDRLAGTLTWTLETEYDQRLTDAYKHLRELNADVEVLTAQYQSFVRTRQAAVHSYEGYDIPLKRLRTRVADAVQHLNLLMGRQGHMLETVAVTELAARRELLETYQNQARYAFAESFDRAAKTQASEERS
jgi:Tfp pilus assembly protein PilF